MDQREARTDYITAFYAAFTGLMSEQWHALPAIVVSFDPVKLTITARSALSFKFRQQNGSQVLKAPLFTTVPVCFPGGGGFISTWPLAAGDEVLLVFADRAIDNWQVKGADSGPQVQAVAHLHSLNDGFAIPGPRSYPKVPAGVSTVNAQLRSQDGQTLIELTPDGRVNIKAPLSAKVTVDGTVLEVTPAGVNITGNVIVTGTVTAAGFITPP